MPIERIETLVIGGGQAGLTMSHRLKQRGLNHLVLERARIAERWRSERWDGLKFQFPNWSVRLPDFSFPHDDPEAFATSGDIVKFIDAFADFVAPPIRCGVEVTRLRRREGAAGFVAETSDGEIEAKNVVVATGPYQRPLMPDMLRDENIFQVHANSYKNPDNAAARRRAGGRRRRVRGADRRRAASRRPPRLSLGWPAHKDAAPLSRTGFDVVVRRDAPVRHDAGAADDPDKSLDIRRLWRPHHRLPPLRRRWHHAARKDRGGARGRARYRPRSRREVSRPAISTTRPSST